MEAQRASNWPPAQNVPSWNGKFALFLLKKGLTYYIKFSSKDDPKY